MINGGVGARWGDRETAVGLGCVTVRRAQLVGPGAPAEPWRGEGHMCENSFSLWAPSLPSHDWLGHPQPPGRSRTCLSPLTVISSMSPTHHNESGVVQCELPHPSPPPTCPSSRGSHTSRGSALLPGHPATVHQTGGKAVRHGEKQTQGRAAESPSRNSC